MAYLMRPKYQRGGYVKLKNGGSPKGPRLPITAEEDKIANIQYGKPMKDLSITQRTDLRKRIRLGIVDKITFEQYFEDYKGMANDPDYKPKYVKANVGTGMSPQQRRARAEAKNTIEGFESKFGKNKNRRKGIKMKAAIEADPERKQREMAKKAEGRRKRRAQKLGDKRSLTQSEKLLNFEQSLITRQLNDKIKANPKLITDNTDLMDKLSTTVDGDGNIIKSKPTLYEIEKRGLFEIEHQRDVRKKGAMKDFPYNRNPILAPFNRSGGFKDMAEKFIEKNPDPNNPKVRNIIEKANELKITLQPEVPEGIFKTKGLGYKQPGSATGKFIDYANSYLPELVDDKIGIAGYTGNREMLERGLKAKRPISGFNQVSANPFFSPGILGEAFKSIPTPLGTAVLTAGLGIDPTSGIDRATLAAEAIAAPALVKQSAKMGAAQKIFNLGLTPKLAMRAARIASPIGIASLVGEGIFQTGKALYKRKQLLDSMTPTQKDIFLAQEYEDLGGIAGEGAAAGGLIGKKSGPPPESGPTPQGLDYLIKRGRRS